MARMNNIKPKFVDIMPSKMEEGILYISKKYKTAVHLCCCGCGNKVATPLKPGGWKLALDNGNVTLNPSVGNSNFPCRSHYIINHGSIRWAPKMSDEAIAFTRKRDQAAREAYYDKPTEVWWKRLWKGIRNLFRSNLK